MNHGTPSIDDLMELMDKHGIEYSVYTVLEDLEKFIEEALEPSAF